MTQYREHGLGGDLKAWWFYWRLYRNHVAKHRRRIYAENRERGANPLGAFLFAYMESRIIDWPYPHVIRAFPRR